MFGFAKLDLIAAEGTVTKDGPQTLQLFKPGKGVNIFTEKDWYLKEKPSGVHSYLLIYQPAANKPTLLRSHL